MHIPLLVARVLLYPFLYVQQTNFLYETINQNFSLPGSVVAMAKSLFKDEMIFHMKNSSDSDSSTITFHFILFSSQPPKRFVTCKLDDSNPLLSDNPRSYPYLPTGEVVVGEAEVVGAEVVGAMEVNSKLHLTSWEVPYAALYSVQRSASNCSRCAAVSAAGA